MGECSPQRSADRVSTSRVWRNLVSGGDIVDSMVPGRRVRKGGPSRLRRVLSGAGRLRALPLLSGGSSTRDFRPLRPPTPRETVRANGANPGGATSLEGSPRRLRQAGGGIEFSHGEGQGRTRQSRDSCSKGRDLTSLRCVASQSQSSLERGGLAVRSLGRKDLSSLAREHLPKRQMLCAKLLCFLSMGR